MGHRRNEAPEPRPSSMDVCPMQEQEDVWEGEGVLGYLEEGLWI